MPKKFTDLALPKLATPKWLGETYLWLLTLPSVGQLSLSSSAPPKKVVLEMLDYLLMPPWNILRSKLYKNYDRCSQSCNSECSNLFSGDFDNPFFHKYFLQVQNVEEKSTNK